MITQELIEQTEGRFTQRQGIRHEREMKIQSGAVLEADSPDRVRKRIQHLAQMVIESEGVGLPAVDQAQGPGLPTLERIMGTNDLMPISYLERGLRIARTVGRIHVRGPDGNHRGYGTGFLVVEGSKPSSAASPRPQPVDFATAEKVMWEIIRIINRQQDEQTADPARAKNPQSWFRVYLFLLREWYLLTYGEAIGSGRKRLQADALRSKLDTVVAMTQPLLDVLEAGGGAKWRDHLRIYFYPRIADLEYEAIETAPRAVPAGEPKPVTFDSLPKPVSLEEFSSVVATRESRPIAMQLGYTGTPFGAAAVGDVWSGPNQDHRVLLWSDGGHAVLFMRGGVIYAQSGEGFRNDILFGALKLAGLNAFGSMILSQLMVEIALSFTPWGAVWDVVSATKALVRDEKGERDWKGAALSLLPGASLQLATKTRAGRAVIRGAAVAATIGAQAVKTGVRFIGRGAYRLGGKLLRGMWLVGDAGVAGEARSYRFFDEVGKQWHDVPPATAENYIKCNACHFTPPGTGAALQGQVDEILADLAHSPTYASRGRVLVNPKLIKDVVEAYGQWGDHVVEKILQTWQSLPDAAKLANDTLKIAKDLSRIKGAIEIFEDLASSSVNTARGTIYELRWAAKHVDEIAQLGIPVARGRWTGKGLDVLKKGGEAVELKNFNFHDPRFREYPGREVARIIKQVESRLGPGYKDVTKVTVIFSSEAGPMPAVFGQQLTAAMIDLAKRTGRKSADITFGFWP